MRWRVCLLRMDEGKTLIIPGYSNRVLLFLNRLIPRKLRQRLYCLSNAAEEKISEDSKSLDQFEGF